MLRILCILLLISHNVIANWIMEFPIEMNERNISSIKATTNGITIIELDTLDLKLALHGIVTDDVLDDIRRKEGDSTTLLSLGNYGIQMTFDTQSLVLKLSLSPQLMALSSLDFNKNYQVPNYTIPANYTFQNAFNLVSSYSPDSHQHSNSLELVGALNLGGVYGANLIWNGYVDWEDDNETTTGRGPIQLYFDNPNSPYRLTLGEVDTSSSSQLSSLTIAGIEVSRARSQLRPTEQVTSSPNQEFQLTESADVTITVNGLFITKIRLAPGRYSLNDLPVSAGANDVVLTLEYLSGKEETLTFSNFFSHQILAKGFDDFNFSLGIETDYSSTLQATYTENIIASGNYLYGLTNEITIGLNSTYHPNGQILGGNMTVNHPIGVITIRPSLSYSEGAISSVAAIDYSNTFFSTPAYSGTDIRFNVEYLSNYSSSPWDENEAVTVNRYNMNINQSIMQQLSFDFIGNYDDYKESDNYRIQAALNWSINNITLKLGSTYEYIGESNFDETLYFVNIRWRESVPNTEFQSLITYDSRYDYTRAEVSKNTDSYVGSTGGLIAYNQYEDTSSTEAEVHHIANRFRASAYYYQNNTNKTSNVSSNLSSTLAIVDNSISISPQPIAPIAIVSVHPSLKSAVNINPTIERNIEAIATPTLSSHISLVPHMKNQLITESPMAPLGYNLGSGSHEITPGSLTGYKIMVGSDYSKTIIGTLTHINGEPVILQSGIAKKNEHSVSFFTNSQGRFVLEGMSSGRYLLSITTMKNSEGELLIPDTPELLLNIGDVMLRTKNILNQPHYKE